jgi:putative multiple sugar transport system substrate-binding protein
MVDKPCLSARQAGTINDTKTYNNGVKVVPSILLTPVMRRQVELPGAGRRSGYYKADELK